jgi:hypothetical protein
MMYVGVVAIAFIHVSLMSLILLDLLLLYEPEWLGQERNGLIDLFVTTIYLILAISSTE